MAVPWPPHRAMHPLHCCPPKAFLTKKCQIQGLGVMFSFGHSIISFIMEVDRDYRFYGNLFCLSSLIKLPFFSAFDRRETETYCSYMLTIVLCLCWLSQ